MWGEKFLSSFIIFRAIHTATAWRFKKFSFLRFSILHSWKNFPTVFHRSSQTFSVPSSFRIRISVEARNFFFRRSRHEKLPHFHRHWKTIFIHISRKIISSRQTADIYKARTRKYCLNCFSLKGQDSLQKYVCTLGSMSPNKNIVKIVDLKGLTNFSHIFQVNWFIL